MARRRWVASARTASTWVPERCGAPDVLTTSSRYANLAQNLVSDKQHNSLDAIDTLENTKLRSSEESKAAFKIRKHSQIELVKISFRFRVNLNQTNSKTSTNNTTLSSCQEEGIIWDGYIWKGDLYLTIPDGLVIERSKEAFIELLEFAEEELHCNCIIASFSKTRNDRVATMRMFMFFGFELLPPANPKATFCDPRDEKICMAYQIC